MQFVRQNISVDSFKTIRKKLLFSVLVISSVFTTMITCLDLYLQYSEQVDDVEQKVNHIHQSFANSLSYSLWHLDDEQLNFQLDGILATSYFIEAAILDAKGKKLYSKFQETAQEDSTYHRSIPLYYTHGEKTEQIGSLKIVVSQSYIYQKLQSKFLTTLIFQAIKVFVVSFLLLHIFSKIVTEHLIFINRYLKYFDWTFTKKHKKLRLKRQGDHYKDELDQLSDEINHSLSTARDNVKKINQLQISAERALDRERQFILTMNHELRTPLNAILGMAEVLHSEYNTEESQKYLNLQLKAGKTLLSLIDSIQDFSKIDAGEVSLNNRAINLFEIIEETVSMLQKDAEKVQTRMEFFCDKNIPTSLLGDGEKLLQIFLSIITNSIKYSKGSKIIVVADLKEQDGPNFIVQVTIIDNGVGLEQSEIDKIFEPFQRLSNENHPTTPGRGLGLYVTKSFVILMGGKIEVESEPHIKTSFKMRIPFEAISMEKQTSDSLVEGVKALNPSSVVMNRLEFPPGMVVLAVDDNEDNLFLLEMILGKSGFSVVKSNDGLQAFNYFIAHQVDLVIMDIQMPIMDGFESTRKIREWESENKRVSTPIIALTAGYAKNSLQDSKKQGFSDYLGKPVRKKVLLESIQNVVFHPHVYS